MAAFDLKRLPTKVVQQVRTLLEGRSWTGGRTCWCSAPGSGKTHLLCGDRARNWCGRAGKVLFTHVQPAGAGTAGGQAGPEAEPSAEADWPGYEVLILDDLGYVQQSREEMEVLFTLLAERYERGSVMLTSNLPFSQWEQIFKDPMTTAAAIDRLVHHSVIVELNLPSYRAEQAKKAKHAKNNGEDKGA